MRTSSMHEASWLGEDVARYVEDVDEEVRVNLIQLFLLYTLRNRGTAHAGLGFLDSKSDTLLIQLPCDAEPVLAQTRTPTRRPRVDVTVYQDVCTTC